MNPSSPHSDYTSLVIIAFPLLGTSLSNTAKLNKTWNKTALLRDAWIAKHDALRAERRGDVVREGCLIGEA